MLIVFHSKSSAEVLMFDRHALPILRAAGKDFEGGELPERGVITRDQLPAAIAGIEGAMAITKENDENPDTDDDNDDKVHPINEPVSFRRRAYPLLAMLRLAQEKQEDVLWEPATVW
ncbi:MAG TPA: DUF1840 domain-containing protein [Burkholderiaceae bacterium]|nr:DUF1840 domain-containing protein [Burkholderiaceae bacterium]